jgi:hypothetical protein
MVGINMAFFVGGPQLGEFEAGAVANWIGAPLSVITGGLGCLLATAWVAATTPMIRHYRSPVVEVPAASGTKDTKETKATKETKEAKETEEREVSL